MTRDRLVLDVMLGKLATYLRMCGYDAAYALDADLERDDAIRAFARRENRILLTRDERLANRTRDAILLESRDIEQQLAELSATGFRLELPDEPVRCSVCNGRVVAVETADRPTHAPDDVADLWRCRDCGQYFWKGSHWDAVAETLADIEAD